MPRPRRALPVAFCILNYGLLAACHRGPMPIRVSQSGAGAYESALVADEAGFAVAWYDTRDGNPEIYLRLLDDQGRPSGPERRLTETADASYEASLERLGDGFAVAWYDQASDGGHTAMLSLWKRDGTRRWVTSIAPASRNPVIGTDGHAIVAAWIQADDAGGGEAVWVGAWGEDGHERRERVRIGPASKSTWNLNLALADSDVWVVFDAETSTRSSELFLGRVDASGAHLVRLTADDGAASKYPDMKINGEGQVALTWYDMRDGNEEVYLFVGLPPDSSGEIERRAHRVTTTTGESVGAYLAWNAGRVGLAWSDKTPGAHEIYFQSFDSTGAPMGSAERVTQTDAWSLVPAIRPWRDRFALAWTEYQPASSRIHDGTGEVDFTVVG